MSCWITLAGKRCGQRQAAMDGTLQLLELLLPRNCKLSSLKPRCILPPSTPRPATAHSQTPRPATDPGSGPGAGPECARTLHEKRSKGAGGEAGVPSSLQMGCQSPSHTWSQAAPCPAEASALRMPCASLGSSSQLPALLLPHPAQSRRWHWPSRSRTGSCAAIEGWEQDAGHGWAHVLCRAFDGIEPQQRSTSHTHSAGPLCLAALSSTTLSRCSTLVCCRRSTHQLLVLRHVHRELKGFVPARVLGGGFDGRLPLHAVAHKQPGKGAVTGEVSEMHDGCKRACLQEHAACCWAGSLLCCFVRHTQHSLHKGRALGEKVHARHLQKGNACAGMAGWWSRPRSSFMPAGPVPLMRGISAQR